MTTTRHRNTLSPRSAVSRQHATLVALLVMTLAFCGCEFFFGRSWVRTYKGAPLVFTAPKDSSDAIWSRALGWFGGYTTPKLAAKSDTLITSVETPSAKGTYSVAIARYDTAGAVHFEVRYTVSDKKNKDVVDRAKDRAYELAYIARTGDNQQAFIMRGSQ